MHTEGRRVFHTTNWSVVSSAGQKESEERQAALAHLCETYWYPLYSCVRRNGFSPADAQDLTQAFLCKLLAKEQFALADRERGRFRTFLLRALENFLHTQHRDANAQKRGGGKIIFSREALNAEAYYALEPVDTLSPARLFDKNWAGALLQAALGKLQQEFALRSRSELFEALEPHLWGDDTSTPYSEIAANLHMSHVAVRVTLKRLRQRFQELLRAEIAATVESPDDVEDELAYLREALRP
jgi:RNA polymerase sigma factor (sigma-70 family)